MGLDNALVFACLDGFAVGTLPQEEIDCAEDDAFARTGLSGNDGEPAIERDVELVNEREVLNV